MSIDSSLHLRWEAELSTPRRQQRRDRRIVSAYVVQVECAGIIDLCDQFAFRHADLVFVHDARVHCLEDAVRL